MELQTTISSQVLTEYNNPIEIQYEQEHGKPMPSKNHAKVQNRISAALTQRYEENYDIYTEFTLELNGEKSVPDIAVFPIEPSDWEHDVIRGTQPPLLAVEILSPKQSFDEIVTKIRTVYFPNGVKSAWLVTPSTQSILIFMPNQKPKMYSEGILQDVASGFEVDLGKIFK